MKNRWFIWTIVFLVVVGAGLVSYILISSQDTDADVSWIVHKDAKQVKNK